MITITGYDEMHSAVFLTTVIKKSALFSKRATKILYVHVCGYSSLFLWISDTHGGEYYYLLVWDAL
jgi:hypothetical protein